MSINGRVAVVTGASSGIGAAIARELSAAGCKLLLAGRDESRLNAVAGSLTTESFAVSVDVASPGAAQLLLDRSLYYFGRTDIVVNNAGMLAMGAADDIDLDHVSQMIQVNLEATVRCSYVFARYFKSQASGAIVNVSSVAAFGARPTMGVYAGLKAAIETFTNALRIELGPRGIRVGCVAPGSTRTEMLTELRSHINVANELPAADPQDIARAVRFMLDQPTSANVAGIRIYSAYEGS